MRGTMLWFNEAKGHGFISTEEGERLYADGSDFMGGPPEGYCAGIPVTFRVSEGDERKAEEISVVVTDAPRRARRRHSGSVR